MKVRLQISKEGSVLHEDVYEVKDADSFGRACMEAWWTLREQAAKQESSVGALMENLDRGVLDRLNGASIGFRIV